jgi:hypothetical protein
VLIGKLAQQHVARIAATLGTLNRSFLTFAEGIFMKFKSCFKLACSLVTLVSFPLLVNASAQTAPVSGFAQSFLMGLKLSNSTITVLETGEKVKTDSTGHFGPIQYPVGQPITLEFSKWGYKSTQSATVIVPTEGLVTAYDNITFQIPSVESYYLLSVIMGATVDDNSCHLTATVTGYHKTMGDLPQGEPDVTVTLSPAVNETPFYFGIYQSGPLKNKTNPFAKGLKQTTEDGGVAFFNIPPSEKPYSLIAHKNGKQFTESTFLCKKGTFINISPPRGPMVIDNKS